MKAQFAKQERKTRWAQAMKGALMLTLLAACGYAGAAQEARVQTVSLPVVRQTISEWSVSKGTMEDVRAQLAQEREREIALLDSVISHPDSSEEIIAQALAQKTQLVSRMETEAQTQAALSYMGYEQVGVVCGADVMTVIAPWQYAVDEQERVRMIDAAAGQAKLSPECVKIILAKNE